MFNFSSIFTVNEYEREFISSTEREGINKVHPYENSKDERLNTLE